MITFAQLWNAHPSNGAPPNNYPCSSGARHNYENQCTIRLGVAICGAGGSLVGFSGTFCWHGHGRSHPLRVHDMVRWLNRGVAGFAGRVEIKERTTGRPVSRGDFAGRRGIVMWEDFWGTGYRGDHIDLWNGVSIAQGELDYFGRSRRVHFWGVL